MKGGVKTNKRL